MTNRTEHDPLAELSALGVAVWLDDLSRELLAGGELAFLIADRHVVGVTTNPTIFASALSKGDRYNGQLRDLAERGADAEAAVFAVTTDDVRSACDVLAPVYDRTAGLDGCVSVEVDPRLSRDADATIEMARKLRATVDRDNLFVEDPGTREGLTAITQAISEGISVNVTLIFSLERYRAVMDAYLTGLERASAIGLQLDDIRSVASFSSPGSIPKLTSASTAPAPGTPPACEGRRRLRTRAWPTRPSANSAGQSGGTDWPSWAPGPSGRCGHLPESRTRPIRTRCT